jgi:phosphoglycerate dehydrogenase-like enzyme
MRLLIAEAEHARYAELLAPATGHIEVRAGADVNALLELAEGCDIWLGQPDLLAALLRGGHKPQWLQSTWAGITPLLAADLPKDYQLSRAVGIFGQVMAEYVLAHMLAHERSLFARRAAQAQQRWDNRLPRSLAGLKVLIVGCGDIGQAVAEFLQPFGVELTGIASQARQQAPFSKVLAMGALEAQLASADYVVNLLPDTPATQNIYDAKAFAAMQASSVFINAGRGVAVVDADLVSALQQQQIAAAVIDVCRQEPLPVGHVFWHAPNLLLTGHSSAPTQPALMAQLFIDNLQRFNKGERLHGAVDFARGY